MRIASFSLEADNIPSFARRSILVSRETMIPYHEGYFWQVRARALDLLRAEYASDPRALADFPRGYRPDYFLVESDGFTASSVRRTCIGEFHRLSDAIARDLEQGAYPRWRRSWTAARSFASGSWSCWRRRASWRRWSGKL